MATAKQTEANRANSQKSTGPRTESGKHRASLNALKHGCTSQTIILPGEDSQHFIVFTQSFIEDFAPQGALERALVQELAHTQWSLQRTRAHEASLFALGHEKHADAIQTDGDQAVQAAFAGAIVFKAEGDSLKNVSLYLQRANRMFHTTLKALREIQAVRMAREQAELALAIECAGIHQLEGMPFIPSELGFVCSPSEIAPLVRRQLFLLTHRKSQRLPPRPKISVANAA